MLVAALHPLYRYLFILSYFILYTYPSPSLLLSSNSLPSFPSSASFSSLSAFNLLFQSSNSLLWFSSSASLPSYLLLRSPLSLPLLAFQPLSHSWFPPTHTLSSTLPSPFTSSLLKTNRSRTNKTFQRPFPRSFKSLFTYSIYFNCELRGH